MIFYKNQQEVATKRKLGSTDKLKRCKPRIGKAFGLNFRNRLFEWIFT